MSFFRNTRLLAKIFLGIVLVVIAVKFASRGPDFEMNWSREVPSKYSAEELAAALKNTRNWPSFHHALKDAKLFRVVKKDGKEIETAVTAPDDIEKGMIAVLEIEPVGKEWKRYQIRALLTEVDPGKKLAFRLLDDSTGKTAKMIRGLEWSVSVHANTPAMAAKGYPGSAQGEAKAETTSARSRFFGRVATKILMNQVYQIDLVRLASFEENVEAKQGKFAPVYQ